MNIQMEGYDTPKKDFIMLLSTVKYGNPKTCSPGNDILMNSLIKGRFVITRLNAE